ncbi:MAG: asparagine synthase-related protein [Candidatus Binatia bacterium]
MARLAALDHGGRWSACSPTPTRRLLGRPLRGAAAAAFRAVQAPLAGDLDAVGRSLWVDAKSQLAEQLLMKVDKATMAAALEARCPFLDRCWSEYAGRGVADGVEAARRRQAGLGASCCAPGARRAARSAQARLRGAARSAP